MRADWSRLERWRKAHDFCPSQPGDHFGLFEIPYYDIKGRPSINHLRVIASSGDWRAAKLGPEFSWQHVSVSLYNRTPTWSEMCYVKSLFWEDEEVVMQLHVAKSKHINFHENCLHLWKPNDDLGLQIPLPPAKTIA